MTEDLPFQLSQLELGLVLPQQGAPPRRKEVCRMLGPELVASLWFYGCQSAPSLPQEEGWAGIMIVIAEWKPELREAERLVQSHIKRCPTDLGERQRFPMERQMGRTLGSWWTTLKWFERWKLQSGRKAGIPGNNPLERRGHWLRG